MMNRLKKIIAVLMALILLGVSGNKISGVRVLAADNTLKICMGESNTARHHKAVALGEETEELRFVLKEGSAKSSSYISSNPSCFKIKNTTEGKCIVETLAEGSGLVILTVKTKEGITYTEKLLISVYTRIGNNNGVVNKNTDVYMGASVDSGVENYDDKGDLTKNTKLTITASCGEFYIFKTLDGTTFRDGKDTGFVKKSDINILASSIKISEKNMSVELNSKTKLTAIVTPQIATNKNIIWTSSNPKIAAVDLNGNIVGKSEGTVLVTVSTKDGTNIKESIYITVYDSLPNIVGCINTDSKLYKIANKEYVRGDGKKGDGLIIIGQSENYYRVKMDNPQLYKDSDLDEYCYVLKCKVTIPLQSIKFDKNIISMQTNQSMQLKTIINPNNASNKDVRYFSDNVLVAKVNSDGLLTTYKEGVVNITVITEDGNRKAFCKVYVSDKKNVVWMDTKINGNKTFQKQIKEKLKAKGKDDESILITWNGFKSVKKYILQRANKNSNKYKTLKKLSKNRKQYIDKNVRFYKKYKYRLLIIKTNGKKIYSNVVIARTKDSKVNITLKSRGYTTKSIKLSWNKQKHVDKYIILRKKGKKGKYKIIKVLSRRKKSFIDKSVKYYTDYYYKVKVIKTNKKNKSSNIVKGITKYKFSKTKNLDFFKIKYPFICFDNTKNINDYYVYDKYYSPVKYQFDGKILKIHLYVEFAKYVENEKSGYTKMPASRTDGKGGKSFIELYKTGIKENFEVDFAENKYEFQGINFSIEIIFHERGKEKYHNNQYFNEILIGGECPNCSSKGNHWYHENPAYIWLGDEGKWSSNYARIYIPYDYQLKDNIDIGYTDSFDKDEFIYMTAHETGHLLGLDDGYFADYDRFTDNSETGVKCQDWFYYNMYDNLMKQEEWDKPIVANDLEMMLYAYQTGSGKPWESLQSYKTVEELNMMISPCIKNQKDLYDDKE